ncbi:uncharacterized protein LOC143269176 [Peromyscus maniculatus bairdii]|uniref:uncharacterized protein LOC143269176 n=1 Tax=Peromyscus maniculatus bairdii TaxID=230844 RepID=UPI003FD2297C
MERMPPARHPLCPGAPDVQAAARREGQKSGWRASLGVGEQSGGGEPSLRDENAAPEGRMGQSGTQEPSRDRRGSKAGMRCAGCGLKAPPPRHGCARGREICSTL